MDTAAIKQPINQFLQALSEKIKVDQVYIFGSQISSGANEESDIDILVVSEDLQQLSEDERLDLLYRASRFIRPEIHPWGVTRKELEEASALTTIGYARKSGVTFL